jgi:hypothetical protein
LWPTSVLLLLLLLLLLLCAGVEAPAAGSRYLMQERYPQPGKGAPSVANVTTAVKEAVQAAEPKRSSAGTLTGSALLAVAAAAAAVFAL